MIQLRAPSRELVFLLHPGLGSIRPYWELCWPRDPVVTRLAEGQIRKAGVVIATPPWPPGWAPGRYLAILDADGLHPEGWAEVTGSVDIDTQRGLACCPEHIRERYFHTAVAVNAASMETPRTILHQSALYWYEREHEAAVESEERMAKLRALANLVNDMRGRLAGHVRVCLIADCAVCAVAADGAEVKL